MVGAKTAMAMWKLGLMAVAAAAAPAAAGGRLVRAEGFDAPPSWAVMPVRGEEMRIGRVDNPPEIPSCDLGGMYVRGASRQYKVPFGWQCGDMAYGAMIGASSLAWAPKQGFMVPDDRGRCYTPVALLLPHGACRSPQSAFERCLGDNAMGEMCDVLCPDAGQDSAKFSRALFDYKAAFLVGDFDKGRFDRAAVADYVRYGGTLVCTRGHFADGLLDASLAEAGEAAKACWADAGGEVSAWIRDCGKGRVVEVSDFGAKTVRRLLAACRDDLMPVSVEGDVRWGVNRTREEWVLWLINGGDSAVRVKATLSQTGRAYEAEVPAGKVKLVSMPVGPVAAPAGFRLGYQMDVSRDKIPRMEGLRRIVDMLGKLGYNQFQLYFKNAFAYKAHPEMQKGVSPLTAAEVREVDALCVERGIDLIPYQNVFGHLEPWLRHPKYAHLAELPQNPTTLKKADVARFAHRPESWFDDIPGYQSGSLCATSAESLDFARGLLDELLPNFRSKYVNTGCDEVWDLASDTARSREKILKVGSARVYLDYLKEIEKMVRARGRTMMFWGDIILRSPELVKELPEDAVCLNWGYGEDHPYDLECPVFRKSGKRFYTCPTTGACCALFGNVLRMKRNVDNAFANGVANGAEGMLLTDWGDYGNPQPWIASVPGLVYAAERTKGAHLSDEELARRIDDLLGCRCGAALLRYGYACRASRQDDSGHLGFHILQDRDWKRPDALLDADVEAFLAELKAARSLFDASSAPEWIRSEFEAFDLLARALEARWRGDFEAKRDGLVGEYRRIWTVNNRPGGLDDSVRQVFFGEMHN